MLSREEHACEEEEGVAVCDTVYGTRVSVGVTMSSGIIGGQGGVV